MYLIEQWEWMAVALIAITLAGTVRSSNWMWIAITATVLSGITWRDQTIPSLYQLLIFVPLTLACIGITRLFSKPGSQTDEQENEAIVKAPSPRRVLGRSFVLTQPIVDGTGTIEIEEIVWRLRGEDAKAGETIRVLSVDGIERDLLIVAKAEKT